MYEDILVCEDVDGKDSLWPWWQGWRVLMPCCSGWRRPGETSTPPGQYNLRPTVRHKTKGDGRAGWSGEWGLSNWINGVHEGLNMCVSTRANQTSVCVGTANKKGGMGCIYNNNMHEREANYTSFKILSTRQTWTNYFLLRARFHFNLMKWQSNQQICSCMYVNICTYNVHMFAKVSIRCTVSDR